MKRLILWLALLLPFFANAQVNGTIQKTISTGTVRGNFGSNRVDTLPRVTGVFIDGYILKYHAATNKWYASPDPASSIYWQRSGTTLSPLTAGDSISTTGNITADSLKRTGGTGEQFLMGDGSIQYRDSVQLRIGTWGDSMSSTGEWQTDLTGWLGYNFYNGAVAGEDAQATYNRMAAAPSGLLELPTIIWTGRNGFPDTAATLDYIKDAVALLGHNRFYVVSILNPATAPEGTGDYNLIIDINNRMKALWPNNYIPLREFIVSKYNPSIPQDVIDHALDVPPSSLRIDGTHFNPSGYYWTANYFAQYINILLGIQNIYIPNLATKFLQVQSGGTRNALLAGAEIFSDGNTAYYGGYNGPTATPMNIVIGNDPNNMEILPNGGSLEISAGTTINGNVTVNDTVSVTGTITGSKFISPNMAPMGSNTKFFTMYDAVAGGELKYAALDTVKTYLGLSSYAPLASPTFTGTPSASRLTLNGFTSGLPASSGSGDRGGLTLANSSNIELSFGTVASGSAWLQVSDYGNHATNFELKLNPNGGNVSIGNLAGTGTRMMVADNAGVISTQAIPGGGGGSVTGVAVASANGFSGTSDGNSVVPTLTLTTSINSPVLAGNGTAISAATTTGSGSTVVLATSPVLTTPNIGAATGSTLALSSMAAMGANTPFFTYYDATDGGLLKYRSVANVQSDLGLNTYAPLASPALTGSPTAPTQTQGDNSTKIATTAYVDNAVGSSSGGRYSPTYSNVLNTTSVTSGGDSFYQRNGNIVSVRGYVQFQTVTGGGTSSVISVNLPVASNLTSTTDLIGSAPFSQVAATSNAAIVGEVSGDIAHITFLSNTATTNAAFIYEFSYEVK